MERLMKIYKKIKDGENKKTFLFGMPFSSKEKTVSGYINRRFFGLWKAKKKNYTIRYYLFGLYVWKKRPNTEEVLNELKSYKKNLMTSEEALASNFITLFLKDSNQFNLFYIQNNVFLVIFSNKLFQYDCDFVYNFLHNCLFYSTSFHFKILSPDCALYKEHVDMFKSGNALLYKYIWRYGLVYRTIISNDYEGSDLYLETAYLGLDNYHTDNGRKYLNTPRRKIVKGTTVTDYLKGKTDEEQKKILKAFFDWMFSTYQHPEDKDKLDGKMVDCNLSNFLINGENFIPIDIEFEMESGLPKDYCLWYALGRKEDYLPLYEYFCDIYGLKKKTSFPLFWQYNKNLEKAAVLNKDLRDKYFTEKYLIPEYD